MQGKVKFLLLVAVMCAQNAAAQLCSDPIDTIYGVEQNGDVVPINDNNAGIGPALTKSSDPGYPGSTSDANAIGLDIQTGTFYYFQVNSSGGQKFVSFQVSTNTYTVLAPSPISGGTVKGCVTADGTGYYCIDLSGQLCYYSILSNTWASVGSNMADQFGNDLGTTFTNLGNGDMTIDGLGNLWIIAASNSQWGLYKLNAPLPTSPQATLTLNQMVPPTQSTPSGLPFVGISSSATGQIFLCTTDDLYVLLNNLTIAHINSFSTPGSVVDLTSCNYPLSILPLEWSRFSAIETGQKSVALLWSLYQQMNNKGYMVERSADGKTWDSIGYQINRQGSAETSYEFTDAKPTNGVNYYRICAVDVDGNLSYSTTNAVDLAGHATVNLWPVPAKDVLTVQIGGSTNTNTAAMLIFNYADQKVMTNRLHWGANTVDIRSLAPGFYLVAVHLPNGDVVNEHFIKQ